MKIIKLELKNFKRFTNLTIDGIPADTKLVMLIGANGSGKSSVFDGFELMSSHTKGDGIQNSKYYRKDVNNNIEIAFVDENDKTFKTNERNTELFSNHNSFYGRTSFRQVPRLTRTTLGQGGRINFEGDSDRPRFFIDKDNRFENDIEKMTEIILKEFFRTDNSKLQIQEKYIKPVNSALENIFGQQNATKLKLIEIIPPLEGNVAQINFRKGGSEIHYNYLSAGEKEVFNVLINLLSRQYLYQDTIYFLDELDLHLNTKLQFNLIKEITENWIPTNCQLWTATHSLGFIEYAKQSQQSVIIDFDDLDFDIPQILTPQPKDNPDIYEIAVGKEYLPALFQQMNIYFVENNDKDYYASTGIPNTVFVSDNSRNNVYHKVRATNYKGIVDRDFLSDNDVQQIRQQYPNLRILNYYSIENYMYHPDNLEEYYCTKGLAYNKADYIVQLTEAKNSVKDHIIPSLSLKRTEYPYFGEPEFNGTPKQNRFKNRQENSDQSTILASYFNSNDFETYYKTLPMKSYCTHLSQRQNIAKTDLVKTTWFKTKIEAIING